MKKLIYLFLALIIVACISDDSNNVDDTQVEWLYVHTAIEANATNSTTLVMPVTNDIFAFTDRPNREHKYISAYEFVSYWSEDANNSFQFDPPNAVLTSAHDDGVAEVEVVIIDASTDGDNITYTIQNPKLTENTTFQDVSLFIDGNGSSTSSCSSPDSLTFDLALWHEGYSTGKNTNFDMSKYLETLLIFIRDKKFKTVFITVPSITNGYDNITMTDDLPTINELKSFVNSLAADSIGIGIQFGLNNGDSSDPVPSDTEWFNYDEVSSVVGSNPYILGLDSENYNLNGAKIKAVNTMEFINNIKDKITAAGGPLPIDVAVAGTAAYNNSNNWSSPLVNVYEYYSSWFTNPTPDICTFGNGSKPLCDNEIFSSNVNDPSTAFIKSLNLPIKDPDGIQGGSVKGWPAFSFEQTGEKCLAGCFGIATHNTCGTDNIFGNWDYNCILQFMTLFKEHYYQSSDTPTFVLYQSDYLPLDWLPNGCSEN